MHELKYPGIKTPRIWIVRADEAESAREKGVPYLVSNWSDEKILKAILYRYLQKKFPYIKWHEVFKYQSNYDAMEVYVPPLYRENPGYDTDGFTGDDMEVSDGYRETAGGMDYDPDEVLEYDSMCFKNFFDPSNIYVDIEALQSLKMLPKFMDDIAEAIKCNLINTMWMDGYNKKLGMPLGTWTGGDEAPNLMILDVSGSIPRGVASTMVALIDTLRTQANADLIITSGRSVLFKKGEKLPSPEELSNMCGGCNEAKQFYGILDTHVLGKHWGNVIAFGDWDCPTESRFSRQQQFKPADWKFAKTKVDNLMCFHTHRLTTVGYALWVKECCPNVQETFNTSWVNSIKGKPTIL